jgi:hypothetical protein
MALRIGSGGDQSRLVEIHRALMMAAATRIRAARPRPAIGDILKSRQTQPMEFS